jgi:AcrR family transcriptional regulator
VSPRPYRSAERDAAAEQTRARIISAAVSVLAAIDRGRDFSLEAVAREAGITRLTVYNQFGSRRALLESAFDSLATQGGLYRMREAMTDPDPRAGLDQLVAIFCDFWSVHDGAARRLLAAAVRDPDLEDSLRARNERRRHALSVLVGRMVQRGEVVHDAVRDIVDLLFALTSVDFFTHLKTSKRSTGRTCRLIQRLAADVVARLGSAEG